MGHGRDGRRPGTVPKNRVPDVYKQTLKNLRGVVMPSASLSAQVRYAASRRPHIRAETHRGIDAQNEASFGQMIQCADLLGYRCQMPQRHPQNRSASRKRRLNPTARANCRERIEDRHGKGNVVAHR
jgi:hypothetical protein